MVQINKVNVDGYTAYDVYIKGRFIGRCNSYYDAVAITMLFGYN